MGSFLLLFIWQAAEGHGPTSQEQSPSVSVRTAVELASQAVRASPYSFLAPGPLTGPVVENTHVLSACW